MKRILLFATTTGYQTRAFGEAAARLGVQLVLATDRCDQLEDPWWDGAIAVRFHQDPQTIEALLTAIGSLRVDGVLAVGDRPTVAAAYAAERLALRGNPPHAAMAARDKRLTRERFLEASLLVPDFIVWRRNDPIERVADGLTYPVVVKPTVLSGSRGVIRADTPAELTAAVARVNRLLDAVDIRALRDPAAEHLLIERFIPGREFAIEGVLQDGRLHTFAIFDKPDPLDGPFFEESIYVTPSRAPDDEQRAIREAVAAAASALGLRHGPVHAECRVNGNGVYVLEVAARPIGGLCARALRFEGPGGESAGLEELLLRHAVGESIDLWRREPSASGVMMIPIPRAGVYRGVDGIDRAQEVPGVIEVRITAKPDQVLTPLPEGASYLGFIFARADVPEGVERALRAAHGALTFHIERALPVGGEA